MFDVHLEHFAITDSGKVRRNNEDYVIASRKKRLFIVADGVGGEAKGEVASRKAAKAVHRIFDPANKRIVEALKHANAKLIAINKNREGAAADKYMRTTLTALHVDRNGVGHFAHVGDGRIYLLRNGNLYQETTDQNEPITNAPGQLGFDPNPLIQDIIVPTRHNDVLLLCTDGLHDYLHGNQIREVLQKAADRQITAKQASQKLVELANAAGGKDNITALVLRVIHKKGIATRP